MNKESFDKENVFGKGVPNDAFARYFSADSFLNPLKCENDADLYCQCNI